MFNGVPEAQFHQFIASRSALPLSLPVTLPFHVPPVANSNFSNNIHELQPPYNQLFQSHRHLLHHQSQPAAHEPPDSCTHQEEEKGGEEERVGGRMSFEVVEGVGSATQQINPWSKEEVLALLTIRSSMGNNDFSDFIWGHVSRKLAELGFKRSAEKCKEKFEEVSKFGNNNNTGNYSNYCRSSFNELDALFEDPNQKSMVEDTIRTNIITEEGNSKMGLNLEESSGNETLENPVVEDHHQQVVKKPRRKKRKKQHKLELLKGFSEFVSKVMIQQEELHKRLLEDMERREEERVAKEEAWRKKESDRLKEEFEIRAKEQAIACDREATIIEFLKKFTSSSTSSQFQKEDLLETQDLQNTEYSQAASPSTVLAQSSSKGPASAPVLPVPEAPVSVAPKSSTNPTNPPTSPSTMVQSAKNPNSGTDQNNSPPVHSISYIPVELPVAPSIKSNKNIITSSTSQNSSLISNEIREDQGKRWPRDEVNSLINLRCNLYNSSSSTTEDQKGVIKAPLWERISQGMLELGYKRSAKKCKEKWENINKYFRKTKDTNKKRSVDSKTCPYFHQLSSLYNQGRLGLLPPESEAPENFLETPESQIVRNCSAGFDDDDHQEPRTMAHVDEGAEKNIAQVCSLEFHY